MKFLIKNRKYIDIKIGDIIAVSYKMFGRTFAFKGVCVKIKNLSKLNRSLFLLKANPESNTVIVFNMQTIKYIKKGKAIGINLDKANIRYKLKALKQFY